MTSTRLPRGVLAVAAGVVVVLLALAGRYGWHRDELYFVLCGRHLAWGYVDQPPLVPALARLADVVAPGSLVVLRVLPALFAGVTVLLVALLARELGASRRAQLLAAVFAAVSSSVPAVGHLLSTANLDVLAGLAVIWCSARAVRREDSRWLGLAAALCGVALLNKDLVVLTGGSVLVALVLGGRARLLRSWWLPIGVIVGLLIASPTLVWQVRHHWPEVTMAQSLSQGDGTYGSRTEVLLLQLGLTSPLLVPFLLVALVALWRREDLRAFRFVGLTWVVDLAVILVAGGKAYYDIPALLALLAPAAVVTDGWLEHGKRLRSAVVGAVVALSAVAAAVLFLPVFPTDDVPGFVQAVNQDVDGQVGWPAYTAQVARAYRALPTGADLAPPQILTRSYSQASALARFGPAYHLPQAYSGHNSMADFGRPPDGTVTVLAVGWDSRDQLTTWFRSCAPAGRIHLGIHTETDVEGLRIWRCDDPRAPWPSLWQRIRYIG